MVLVDTPIGKVEESRIALSYWILHLRRQFVIEKVKAPLMIALETGKSFASVMSTLKRVVKLLPTIHKETTGNPNTHILLRERDKILSCHHNGQREKLVAAGLKMVIAEYEHDGYYAFFADLIFIDIALEIAKGNWRPSNLSFVESHCWSGENLPDIETIRETMREALNVKRHNSVN